MDRSSSKRNSASALANSVFPTPVGPRNMKEPVGRLGSAIPARARRTASLTSRMAFGWPITRSPRWSSMRISFSVSPSSIRPAGMPVHAATTSAMSSAVTSSLTMVDSRALVSAVTFSSSSSKVGSSEYRIRDARSKSPSRWALSATARKSSTRTLISPMRSSPCFSASQRVRSSRSSMSFSAISVRILAKRFFEASSFSFDTARSSMRKRST